MLGSKTCEIISILYDVCGAGKYCEEVAIHFRLLVVEGARPKSVLSGGEKYRAILIGCKRGITPKVRIFFYYNKIKIISIFEILDFWCVFRVSHLGVCLIWG